MQEEYDTRVRALEIRLQVCLLSRNVDNVE